MNPNLYRTKNLDGKSVILPKKIVLSSIEDFNSLLPGIKSTIRQYNNEVKIYSNYYRKVYNGQKVPVEIPIDRIDILDDKRDKLGDDLSKLKDRGFLLNDKPDYIKKYNTTFPFIRQKYADKIMAYNNGKVDVLDRPGGIPNVIKDAHLAEHQRRREERIREKLGTKVDYNTKPEVRAKRLEEGKVFYHNFKGKSDEEEDKSDYAGVPEDEGLEPAEDEGDIATQRIKVAPKGGAPKRKSAAPKRKTARKSAVPKRKTARKSAAPKRKTARKSAPKRSVRRTRK